MTHSDNRNKFIYRELLDEFIKIVGYKSNDIIQSINKTSQWGLKSQTINRKYYTIPYPFVYIDIHLRKRDFSKLKNREQKIKLIKDYLIDNYINVPPELWEIGHRDPNDPDTLEEKLVYQPPIQGRFRDRFKYDEMGLTKTPTPQELKNNFDRYYSLAEQKEIYVILQKRLG
jgi:disulfide oxidoreductase YuzD